MKLRNYLVMVSLIFDLSVINNLIVRQIRNLTKILLNEIQKQKDENRNSGNIPKILDVFVKHVCFSILLRNDHILLNSFPF